MSMIGLIGGLALLIILTIRGMNLLIAAPLCALVVAVTGGIALFPETAAEGGVSLFGNFMQGFASFTQSWFLMFLLGAIFGKVMEDTGAAASVARWVVAKLGAKRAALAVVLACAVLTYGGVSLFVVAFSVYPLAVALFREANLPRRFIPATLAFGSVTFTMTSAGSPEIQNWIPIEFLGTSPYAGWQVSLIVAVLMFILGHLWLKWMLNRAVKNGEHFIARENDPVTDKDKELPHPITGLIPLLVVLLVSFMFHDQLGKSALILALLSGILAGVFLSLKYIKNAWDSASRGTTDALIAVANTGAVVGFGSVAKAVPAFTTAVDAVTQIPGSPLIGAAIAVTLIAGLTGSASGGQAIALPILAPLYLGMGVDPNALHRVVSISSGALDSLPHNGYVVTTIRAVAGETHKDAYASVGALTVIVPLIGVVVAIILFSLGM